MAKRPFRLFVDSGHSEEPDTKTYTNLHAAIEAMDKLDPDWQHYAWIVEGRASHTVTHFADGVKIERFRWKQGVSDAIENEVNRRINDGKGEPQSDCPYCHGSGTFSQSVPYWGSEVPMNLSCECLVTNTTKIVEQAVKDEELILVAGKLVEAQ